jgi:hypothetical protein
MKKIFYLASLFSTLSFLTGCFDISEEITIKKDGKGQYINKIDASKFAEQMTIFAAFDSTGEMIPKLKYSLDSTFSVQFSKYYKVKGISNVKIDTSKEYIYTVSMDFNDINSLNEALSIDKPNDQKNLYSWEKGKISRKDVPLNLGSDMKMDDESQKEMLKGFLQDMKYTITYKLPGKVKDCSNKEVKISDDKMTVTLEGNMNDVMEGKIKLGSDITYKK